MKNNLVLSIAAAVVGLLSGPLLQPAIVNGLPNIGWWTITIMFAISALIPPATLVFLAAGARYNAMAQAWSVFFFLAVFLVAAGASALVFFTGSVWATPSSFLFFAWGLGLLTMLGLLKLRLLRSSAKKAAGTAAASAEPSCPPSADGR